MRVTDGFQEFVLEQLAGVPMLRARAMFGGVGLYSGDIFFGIIAADVLYLKTDDSNRALYEHEGMKPFAPYANRPMTMPYHRVPVRVLEDADLLAEWAQRSVQVAKATKVMKRSAPRGSRGSAATRRRI